MSEYNFWYKKFGLFDIWIYKGFFLFQEFKSQISKERISDIKKIQNMSYNIRKNAFYINSIFWYRIGNVFLI